jgi:polyphenol oxidase
MKPVRRVRLQPGVAALHSDIPLDASPAAPMAAGISLARAGDMSRRRAGPARARLFAHLSIGEERVFGLTQVHSRRVVTLAGQDAREVAEMEADGMVSASGDAVLTVTVADCLPIFLVDRATGAYGLVHSGWKGTGIVRAALDAMTAGFGTDPRDLSVTIGPGIGPCCYRVPEERALSFAEEFGASAAARGADDTPRLDLRAANVMLLQAAGVSEITVVDDCTCCTGSLSSFRRQGADAFTLMLALIRRG